MSFKKKKEKHIFKSIYSSILKPKIIKNLQSFTFNILANHENNIIIQNNQFRRLLYKKHENKELCNYLSSKINNLENCLPFSGNNKLIRVDSRQNGNDLVILIPFPKIRSIKKGKQKHTMKKYNKKTLKKKD